MADFSLLRQLLEEKKFSTFIAVIDQMNAQDAADFLSTVKNTHLFMVFRLLKKDAAANIFAQLDSDAQETIIQNMSDKELSHFMDDLFIDDTVDLLEELPANMVCRILKNTSPTLRGEINRFLNYPKNSVGSIMTSELLSLYADWTVDVALEHIRKIGIDKETVYAIYVTDPSKVLLGILELKDLLFAQNHCTIAELMTPSSPRVFTTDEKEKAATMISKYDLLALPVTDSENRLVGIVTVDDAVDVLQETATKDIERMAAITPTEKPYLKTGVLSTWLKRIPWLLLMMLSATVTGTIITHYESALSKIVLLTAFIPMLMGTGGNAGGQASVTVIRGLSLGELHMNNLFRILWKEFRVSLLCGITLAAVIFGKAMLWDRATSAVASVIAIAVLATVLVAKLVGCSLPILAKRIGLDPAVMASPFITTIVDAVALWIYFGVATLILGL